MMNELGAKPYGRLTLEWYTHDSVYKDTQKEQYTIICAIMLSVSWTV
jgi:hypothetical protein